MAIHAWRQASAPAMGKDGQEDGQIQMILTKRLSQKSVALGVNTAGPCQAQKDEALALEVVGGHFGASDMTC